MTQVLENNAANSADPWRRKRPEEGAANVSLSFWVMMLVLGATAWGGVTLAASSLLAKKGPEKLLRVELLLPKLNSNHGERKADAFRTSEPKPSEPAHPKERATTALHLPALFGRGKTVETPHQVGSPVASVEPPRLPMETWLNPLPAQPLTPPPVVETCDAPVVLVQPCTVERGDTPMMRTWKTVTMYSLLTAAAATLVPPPLVVAGPDKGLIGKTDPIEKLQKSIDALIKRIDALEKKPIPATDKDAIAEIFRTELQKLKDGALDDISKNIKMLKTDMSAMQIEQVRQKRDLEDLQIEVEKLRKKLIAAGNAPTPMPAVDKAFMEEFRTSMKALQDTIARLGPTEKRIASYPNGVANGNATAKTGRVILVNLYSDELLFIINGAQYRVAPRTTKVIENIQSGPMQYEVLGDRWGLLENRVTTLAAGDTFTLTAANPR